MSILAYILFFTFLGSVVSLIGGVVLLAKEKWALKVSHLLMSFAAGVLLATALLDLLPEASEETEPSNVFFWVLIGILTFFLLERFVYWFHHHHEHEAKETKPTVPLIILGDSLHNFIDGVVIAATFMTSIPLGIVTALAVAAHEVPQEIGDFAILLNRKLGRKKILMANFFSSLTAIIGALLMFFIGDTVGDLLPIIISLTAGFFIYIAASDLIPEIHHEKRGFAFLESLLLLLGVLTIWLSSQLLSV